MARASIYAAVEHARDSDGDADSEPESSDSDDDEPQYELKDVDLGSAEEFIAFIKAAAPSANTFSLPIGRAAVRKYGGMAPSTKRRRRSLLKKASAGCASIQTFFPAAASQGDSGQVISQT